MSKSEQEFVIWILNVRLKFQFKFKFKAHQFQWFGSLSVIPGIQLVNMLTAYMK